MLPLRLAALVLAFLVCACAAPASDTVGAPDLLWAESVPADCPRFSGTWQIPPDVADCELFEGVAGEVAIHLPAEDGFYLPGLPAVVEIEQDGCRAIRFRVVENRATRPSHEFAGREVRFDLTPSDRRRVAWTETTLSVRHRTEPQGTPIFRGRARSWAEWSLERTGPDQIAYHYAFTEKSATLNAFPFEDSIGSSCRFERVAPR